MIGEEGWSMRRILSYLNKYIELICMMFFCGILCLSVFLQVVTRVMVASFSWTEEMARFSFVWFTFFCISYCIREQGHIGFDLIISRMGERYRHVFRLFIQIVMVAAFLYLFYITVRFIPFGHAKRAPAMDVSMTVLNISAPIGMGLCCLRSLQELIFELIRKGEK